MSTVNCANCGAPLEIPPTARFVSCRHCGGSLEIKRNESVEWTEMLGKVAAETERLRDEVEMLKLDREIEVLDREWETRSSAMMVKDEKGGLRRPTRRRAVAASLGFAVFGVVALCMFPAVVLGDGPPQALGVAAIFLMIAIAGGLATGLVNFGRAERFDAEERRYLQRRAELLARRGKLAEPGAG